VVSLRPGAEIDDVVIRVQRGREARVRFADPTGEPVAGVEAKLFGRVDDEAIAQSSSRIGGFPPVLETVTSDADGMVALTLPRDATLSLTTTREGYHRERFVLEPHASQFEFELKPYEGYRVRVLDDATAQPARQRSILYTIESVVGERRDRIRRAPGSTDAEGVISLDVPEAITTEVWLTIEADTHFAALRVNGAELAAGTVEVRLRRGGVIQGSVRDELGRPIVATVAATLLGAANPTREFRSTASGSDGKFEIKGLRGGEYEVAAATLQYRDSAAARVAVTEGEVKPSRVELTVPAAGTLVGRIVGSREFGGNDRAARHEFAVCRVGGVAPQRLATVREGEEFEVVKLDPGIIEIELHYVRGRDFMRAPIPSQRVEIVAGKVTRVDFDISMLAFGGVVGRVRIDDRDLIGALVTIESAANSWIVADAATDSAGRFAFAELLPGEYVLKGSLAGTESAFVRRRVSVEGGKLVEVDLSALLGGVRGKVVGCDHERGAITVRLIVAPDPSSNDAGFAREIVASQRLAADGSFEFHDVGHGAHWLEVEHDDWSRGWTLVPVFVKAGEPTEQVVLIQPAGGLSIEVVGDADAIAALRELELRCDRVDGARLRAFASRGEDGAFHEDSLPAGAYRIRAGLRARTDEHGQSVPFRELGSLNVVIEPRVTTGATLRL
jgi:Carboxypeptidase regulatory-like domain